MARRSYQYVVPYGQEKKATQDEDFVCVAFFCPPERWAVGALISSFASLGNYGMWGQDDRIAAENFRRAYELSRRDDFMCHVVNEINVSCGDNCGGCSGSGGGVGYVIQYPPNYEPEEPELSDVENLGPLDDGQAVPPELSGTFETADQFNAEMCRLANMGADGWMQAKNMVAAVLDSTTEYSFSLITTALAMALVDGPLPIGDVLAIGVIVAPLLRLALKSISGVSGESITNIFANFDRCEIVEIIYNSTSESGLSNALVDYGHNIVNASTDNESLRMAGRAYVNFTFGNRFSRYIYDGFLTGLASNHEIVCGCGEQEDPDNPWPWMFDYDSEGWYALPSSEMTNSWASGEQFSNNGMLVSTVDNYNVQEVSTWRVDIGDNLLAIGLNDGFRVNYRWLAMNEVDREIRSRAILSDGTVLENGWHPFNWSFKIETGYGYDMHVGKFVQAFEVDMKSSSNGVGGENGKMCMLSVELYTAS